MREQHIIRVTTALARDHGITEISGLPARLSLEALASTTEQSAYVWYAHPPKSAEVMPVADAARIVSDIWYRTLFAAPI